MRFPNISIFLATVCLVSASDDEKRGPSGFTGVRGKKSVPDSTYVGGFEDSDEIRAIGDKRAPSGFLGMRGKKPYEGWTPVDFADVGIKRAPSGFQGMRGKKGLDYGEEFDKRAPNGFLGMRGKKDYDSTYDFLDKRAPSGFLGMRGKKDYESVITEDLKRAPNGFFGMRGKKPARSAGFFGMRGKKYPYEFRGKFVGVRGKKMSNEAIPEYLEDLEKLGDGLDINQLMLLLTENEAFSPEKETAYNGQEY